MLSAIACHKDFISQWSSLNTNNSACTNRFLKFTQKKKTTQGVFQALSDIPTCFAKILCIVESTTNNLLNVIKWCPIVAIQIGFAIQKTRGIETRQKYICALEVKTLTWHNCASTSSLSLALLHCSQFQKHSLSLLVSCTRTFAVNTLTCKAYSSTSSTAHALVYSAQSINPPSFCVSLTLLSNATGKFIHCTPI